MEFLYTIDPNAECPIMLIDRHIGYDSEDGDGIMADKFCRELMFLDTLNKSKIDVWINSPGGNVLDGLQIFNTILKIKTKVDTHNVGMAASIAFPIWLSGRNRYMMDNAVGMVHPTSGGDETIRKVLEDSINTMISSRSYLTSEKIAGMMAATTWMNATECYNMGLCEVETSNGFNKKRATPNLTDATAAYKAYKEIVNSAIQNLKPSKMSKVTNKLQLVDGSNEDAQIAAIDSIINKANEAEARTVKMKLELDEAVTNAAKLKSDLEVANQKVKAAEDAKAASELLAKETEAKNEVTNAVKLGKIENKTETIELWTKNYLANPEGTKAMITAIPLNKKAPAFKTQSSVTNEDSLTLVAASTMIEVRNRLKI
jgi:ATP-dependent protease ClpP protease subunit